jgi:hypothetical protein
VQRSSFPKACRYLALMACLIAPISVRAEPQPELPVLPLPPPLESLVGLPKPHPVGRLTHVRLIRQGAQQRGLPPEVADAVAQVESAYNTEPRQFSTSRVARHFAVGLARGTVGVPLQLIMTGVVRTRRPATLLVTCVCGLSTYMEAEFKAPLSLAPT